MAKKIDLQAVVGRLEKVVKKLEDAVANPHHREKHVLAIRSELANVTDMLSKTPKVKQPRRGRKKGGADPVVTPQILNTQDLLTNSYNPTYAPPVWDGPAPFSTAITTAMDYPHIAYSSLTGGRKPRNNKKSTKRS